MHKSLTRLGLATSLLAIALVPVVTADCSSSSSQESAPPGSDGGGTGGGGGSGALVARCDMLKIADVQGLMTNDVAGDDVTSVGSDSDGQQCIFHDADSEQAVDIIVVPVDDPAAGYDAAKKQATDPVPLAGVGDEAFREKNDFTMYSKHGGLMCTVSTASAVQIPGVSALVVDGKLDLTDAQDEELAKALGTVCNRLFGAGDTTPDLSGL